MAKAQLAFPKGKTRKQVKAKKDRLEAAIVTSVRASCVQRDDHCRFGNLTLQGFGMTVLEPCVTCGERPSHVCDWPSEWAHFGEKKRAKTRGQAPEYRHNTFNSLMLCRLAHYQYDHGQLAIEAMTHLGCNGPLKFRRLT